jgi:hypothetical protein
MKMSTSAETGVQGIDQAVAGQGSTPDLGTIDTTNTGVRPHDGSMPSAHVEPATGVRPLDGSMPSAHVEEAGAVRPHDGSMPSAHTEKI